VVSNRRALGGAVWVLLAGLAGGCAADKSFALVKVTSTSGQFNDVAKLLVDATNGPFRDTLTYAPKPGMMVRFDETTELTFSIGFRTSHQGTLDVGVTPLNAAGLPIGYGRGSATINSGHTIEVKVAVTRGAMPPPPPDGGADVRDGGARDVVSVCEPTMPASCGPGRTCFVGCVGGTTPAGMCTTAGAKMAGELCMRNEDCVAGTQCFTLGCGAATPPKVCLKFCDADTQCGAGKCNTSIPCMTQPTRYKVCSQACDPVGAATSGCAAGLSCFVFAGEVPDCDCIGPTRTGDNGAACTDSQQCKPGLICVTMGGAKACRPLCRLSAPTTCAAGTTCTKLVEPDFSTYGACIP
jgi:hypothetical protein